MAYHVQILLLLFFGTFLYKNYFILYGCIIFSGSSLYKNSILLLFQFSYIYRKRGS